MARRKALSTEITPLAQGRGAKELMRQLTVATAAAKATAQTGRAIANAVKQGATRAMPKQPRRAGPASTGAAAPMAFGFRNASGNAFSETNKTKKSVRVQGSTTMMLVQTNSVSGTAVIPFSTHPMSFNDRFSTLASTYDKYVFYNIRAVYTPLCATTTPGAVAMYFDRDVDDPPASALNVKSIMSMENACMGSAWTKNETRVQRDPNEKRTYFTNAATLELREVEQFKLYVYVLGGPTNTSLGYVTLHYDVELISPVLAPLETVAGGSLAYGSSFGNAAFSGTAGTTTATPFGLPFISDNIGGCIVEVVVSETGAGVNLNSGFQFGVGGTNVGTSIKPGQPFYIMQDSDAQPNTSVWRVYTTMEDAQRKSSRLLYNSAAAQNLFISNTVFYWRVIGATKASSTLVA